MSEEGPAHPYRVGLEQTGFIVVTTGNEVAEHVIDRYLGIVRGITVRSASFGKSFVSAFKSLTAGTSTSTPRFARAGATKPIFR